MLGLCSVVTACGWCLRRALTHSGCTVRTGLSVEIRCFLCSPAHIMVAQGERLQDICRHDRVSFDTDNHVPLCFCVLQSSMLCSDSDAFPAALHSFSSLIQSLPSCWGWVCRTPNCGVYVFWRLLWRTRAESLSPAGRSLSLPL